MPDNNLNYLRVPRMSTTTRDALTGVQNGWVIYNTTTSKMQAYENGSWVDMVSAGGGGGDFTFVTLGSDFTTTVSGPSTVEDLTGLSFSVTSGNTYYFRFVIRFTSTSTTNGARFAVNGPTDSLFTAWQGLSSSTTTTFSTILMRTYDDPVLSGASYSGTPMCVMEGIVTLSASGTLTARIGSELGSGDSITAKAGSFVQYKEIT